MISIIDYGAGNLMSIRNALKSLGAEAEAVSSLDKPDAIVLPGVGHFGDAMGKLEPIRGELMGAIDSGVPFLGLCLGLQVLYEGSGEAPGVKGLGLIKGECKRFDEARSGKVPHMGWNSLALRARGPVSTVSTLQSKVSSLESCPLFEGVEPGESFYFVQSYYAPLSKETVAVCDYGQEFSAAVQKKNVFACQFHPERSGEAGLKVLENFVRLAKG